MKTGFYLALVVVIALWGVVALTGQGQGASAVRQTWEYKLAAFPRAMDREQAKAITQDREQILNSFGVQGWEVVAVTSDEAFVTAYLKRAR